MKKLSFIVAALLVLSAAGCGESAKENERASVTMMMADAGRANKSDNPIIAEFEKRLDMDIDVNLIPSADFTSKFNVMAAGGELPDMTLFSNFDYFNYASQDLFLELDDMLKDYPNLNAIDKSYYDAVAYQGKYYAVPKVNPVQGKNNTVVRKDWLDKLGLAMPTNLEQLREMYNKFTYGDPDGNGQNDTYGVSTTSEVVASVFPDTFMGIFGAHGIQPDYYHLEGNEVVYGAISENYKNALQYLYELYSVDKVIDPDIFIIKTDQARQTFVQGRFGSFTAWWSVGPQVCWQRMIMPAIQGANGESGYRSKSAINGTVCINAETEYPEACMKLLDYLATEEGTILGLYGFEGEHYTKETVTNTEGKEEVLYTRTELGQKEFDNKWLDIMSMFFSGTLANNAYYNDALLMEHITAAENAPLYYNLFEGLTSDELQRYGADLKKFEQEWMIDFITGKTPIDQFDTYVEQWKQKGGEEIFNSLLTVYNGLNNTSYTAKLN